MHVVVASHQPLPAKGYGGPQRVVMALVRGLAALGARVTLLAPPGTRIPEATVVAGPPPPVGGAGAPSPHIPPAPRLVPPPPSPPPPPPPPPPLPTVPRHPSPGAPPPP